MYLQSQLVCAIRGIVRDPLCLSQQAFAMHHTQGIFNYIASSTNASYLDYDLTAGSLCLGQAGVRQPDRGY